MKAIGRMDITGQWTRAGDLRQPRSGHSVIYDGSYLIVVGGNGQYATEKCSINSDSISCISQTPELLGYYNYPEPFLISEPFCGTTTTSATTTTTTQNPDPFKPKLQCKVLLIKFCFSCGLVWT